MSPIATKFIALFTRRTNTVLQRDSYIKSIQIPDQWTTLILWISQKTVMPSTDDACHECTSICIDMEFVED